MWLVWFPWRLRKWRLDIGSAIGIQQGVLLPAFTDTHSLCCFTTIHFQLNQAEILLKMIDYMTTVTTML